MRPAGTSSRTLSLLALHREHSRIRHISGDLNGLRHFKQLACPGLAGIGSVIFKTGFAFEALFGNLILFFFLVGGIYNLTPHKRARRVIIKSGS